MAFRVEKDAIVCLIFPTVTSPLTLAALPSCEVRHLAVAKWAEAILLLPEREQRLLPFQVVSHLSVEAFFQVPFPFGVGRVRFAADRDVPLNGDAPRLHETNGLAMPPLV